MAASKQWKWLVGGKITAVTEEPDADGWNPSASMVTIEVTFTKPRTAYNYGEAIPNCKSVRLQVWQDEEGNGAGELVFIDALTLVPDDSPSTVLHG